MTLLALQYTRSVAIWSLALGAMVATTVAQTPIAHWTFDDHLNDYTQTTINDTQTSGGVSDAVWADTNADGLSYTRGKIGGAVRLAGTASDYFQIASLSEISNTIALPDAVDATPGTGITFSAWIYSFGGGSSYQGVLMSSEVTDRTSANPGVDELNQNWGLAYDRGNLRLDSRLSGAGVQSANGSLPIGQWHHVAMVWGADQTTVDDFLVPRRMYLDGVQTSVSLDTGIAKFISSGSWRIGSEALNRNFVGLLDDLAVYGSALTPAQVAAIAAAGNSGTNASGVATSAVLAGDVDGSGVVDMEDFNLLRDNLTKNVTARNLGDLNGDRQVDLNDFQEWLDVASPAMQAQALASLGMTSVPEPASSLLVGVIVAAGVVRLRRTLPCRLFALTTMVTLLCCASGGPLFAQQLKLQVDRQSGALSLTGADASAVDFAGYQVASQRGTLADASWNGMRDTETDWVVLGTPGSGSLAEANSSGVSTAGAVANNTVSFALGNAYVPSSVLAELALGVDVEANDLSLVYYDQVAGITRNGSVEFVGEKIFNNIGVTVDLANGRAYLENESSNDLTITGYTIESSLGLLNVGSGYTGLGGSFQTGPAVPDGSGLGALDLSGNGMLLASSMAASSLGIDLGIVVDPSPASLVSANGDLSFNFILGGTAEVSRAGFVKYINIPTVLLGDFNGDLVVNLADYTVWRDNLGAATDDALMGAGDGNPGVDTGDYDLWKANFGSQSGAGASASVNSAPVPEPATLTVCAFAGLALMTYGRKRFLTVR
ncbi:LamG-like jellyroll fold domain-containing protein [Aeoliella sp. SH292]|uniref:LamG-like jellyroll fold domain-containing protein n=1 Tax=Aeoliella sp. SH292 TaxID=3454464 RepID=UPI003F970EC9